MENNEETNPWSHPQTDFEDILFKEVFPRLSWDDKMGLAVSRVNKTWRTLFTSNKLWKWFLQNELSFIDVNNSTDYYKTFLEAMASWRSK